MAKGSNMSKCRGTESVCDKKHNYRSLIRVCRSMTNSGFILEFDVECFGYRPDKDQVLVLAKSLCCCLHKDLDGLVREIALDKSQLEFDF